MLLILKLMYNYLIVMPIILPVGWKRLTRLTKIPDGISKWSKNGRKLAIYMDSGEIKSVFDDKCPHNNRISITEHHEIEMLSTRPFITCTEHGAGYDLIGGDQIKGPGNCNLEFVEYRIAGKFLEVYV